MTTQRDSHSSQIDDAAADWVARVDRGALTPEEEGALTAWLSADIRHAGAFARAEAVFAYTERARDVLGYGT